MYERHQKKIYILIDDYDLPMFQSMMHGFSEDCEQLYRELLPNQWLYNEKIAKIIISG
jgi:hypothetical protein